MRPPLYEKIAADLQEAITRGEFPTIPTIHELAERWDVAYHTMWKAVAILSEKGVVSPRRGRRMALGKASSQTGGGAQQPTRCNSSTDRIYAVLKNRILDGVYRIGQALPKTEFLAESQGVSRATVLRMFVRLETEGLAHRHKRKWQVGPRPTREAPSVLRFSSDNTPTVLMFVNSTFDWNDHFLQPFTAQFMLAFTNEMMSHGHHLVQLHRWQQEVRDGPSEPVPFAEVATLIRRLGDRYAGSILFSAFPAQEHLENWVSWLTQKKKPVVFFDFADRGDYLSAVAGSNRSCYYRLHICEMDGVALALKELVRWGHRSIGVHYSDRIDWAVRRADLIAEAASHMEPAPRIVRGIWSGSDDGLFNQESLPRLKLFTTRLRNAAGLTDDVRSADAQSMARYRGLLLSRARSLVDLMVEGKPTALVCGNESFAREHLSWFSELGMSIPRDLSMVAFDNTLMSNTLPIATVDWGFARLGYLAGHILIGDMPIRVGRDRSIPGRCTLIDRGSIGKPATPSAMWNSPFRSKG